MILCCKRRQFLFFLAVAGGGRVEAFQFRTQSRSRQRWSRCIATSSVSEDVEEWSCTVVHEGEEYCFLDDRYVNSIKDESLYDCDGENCRLVKLEGVPEVDERLTSVLSSPSFWDKALQSKPIIFSLLAFGTYDPTAHLFQSTIQFLQSAENKWIAVDGGAYQASIIAPAINGVVVPAMSLLFANMIATTINTLKQRQRDIQLAMHVEAAHLRILSLCLDDEQNTAVVVRTDDSSRFVPAQAQLLTKCQQHLWQYTSRLLEEAEGGVSFEDRSMESELIGVISGLHHIAAGSGQVSPMVWSQAMQACQVLMEQRAKRITAMQSTFPKLHFAVLVALGSSLLVAFFMETDQDILVFLNAIQLRLLWSILVGTFSVMGLVCYDLSNPFRGSYQISKRSSMMDQLRTIRQGVFLSLIRRQEEEGRECQD